MITPSSAPLAIPCDDPRFPPRLRERLRSDAPEVLHVRGNSELLATVRTAVFCSANPPADLVLPAVDLGKALWAGGQCVAGGFQAPVERLLLSSSIRGGVPVVMSPARTIAAMRLEPEWRRAVQEGRLTLVSRFAARRRPDSGMAIQRNRLVAALAEEIIIVHASPGGRVYALVREALSWGIEVYCIAHPANEPLLLLGAKPWPASRRTAGGDHRSGELRANLSPT